MTSCQFNATSSGIGDFIVASATAGHVTPENSNVANGKTYTYYSQNFDLSTPPKVIAWEAGSGTYTILTHKLKRTTITATSNGDLLPVNFTTPPIVDVYASPGGTLEPPYPRYTYNVGALTLIESHAANAATYTLTPVSGLDYNLTVSDGSNVVIPAAGISLVIPSGATIGFTSGSPGRIWFAVFNNNGTPVLAVRRCASNIAQPYTVTSPIEALPANATLISAASDFSHIFYGSAAVTSKPWLWIAFATYETLAMSAGVWNISPTSISYVDKSTPRPGHVLQRLAVNAWGAIFVGVLGFNNGIVMNMTMQSMVHAVNIKSSALLYIVDLSAQIIGLYLFALNPTGGVYTQIQISEFYAGANDAMTCTPINFSLHFPARIDPSYLHNVQSLSATANYYYALNNAAEMTLEEIMV